MILVGVGGNLVSARYGPPRDTLSAALGVLRREGIRIRTRSGWYRTQPVPRSHQPWFINAVICLGTDLGANDLLAVLQAVEARFGRIRGEADAARVLDLDIIDYRGEVWNTESLVLPHPRMHQRRFVLAPIVEIAPEWRHPILRLTAAQLLSLVPAGQEIERLTC